MIEILKQTYLPLLSTILMMVALGFFNTLVYMELDRMGHSEFIVGLATSLYYLGLLIGSMFINSYVIKHGYIKTYVAFTTLMVVSTALYDLTTNIYIWMILRVIVGFSLAASFVVIMSWLMNLAKLENRGKCMALYNIVLYASVTLGQVLIAYMPECPQIIFLYISLLIALSIVPLLLTKTSVPETKNSVSLSIIELFKISKTAKISTIGAGVLQATMYGLLPIYCILIQFSNEQLSLLMSSMVFGGMLLQYPLGRLSDHIERKKVIIALYILLVIDSSLIIIAPADPYILAFLMFLFGGFCFAIYPISLNILGDRVPVSSITSINQGVLFSNSLGAIIGPMVAALPVQLMGYNGLFIFNIIICLIVLSLIYLFRKRRKIEKN